MSRTTNTFVSAAAVAIALAAFMASAAKATTTFTAGSTSGRIEATQTTEQVFTTNVGALRCNSSTQTGTFTASSFTELSVTPSYSGCRAFGFLTVTVDVEGCFYRLTGNATGSTVTFGVVCPAGKELHITSAGCVLDIPAQTNKEHIGLKSNSTHSPDDIDATLTLTELTYNATSGCINAGEASNGSITGGATYKAFNTVGSQVNLTADA